MTVVLTASRKSIERTMRTVVLIEAFASVVLLTIAGFAMRAAFLARRAVRAEEAMRRFLEDAGHDLRTPAANISASAEALLRGDCRHHEREELEVAMIRESQRMGRLVADLVARAREHGADPAITTADTPTTTLDLEAAASDPTSTTVDATTATVDLTSVVGRAAMHLRHRHPDLTVDVDAPPATPVPGDEMALTRLVGNLLDNAANASPPGGPITIGLRRTGHRVELVVTDSGPGIPAEERERIFERFVRLDPARRRNTDGSGLGLPIARSIARAHGGDLVATAPNGARGARFVAWLPALASGVAAGEGSGPAADPEPPGDAGEPPAIHHRSQLSTCRLQSLNSQSE